MASLSELLKKQDFDSIPLPDCLMSVTVKLVPRPPIPKKQVAPKVRRTDGRHHQGKMRSAAVSAVPRCFTVKSPMPSSSPKPKVARFATENCQSTSMLNGTHQLGVDSFPLASPISFNEWYPEDNEFIEQYDASQRQRVIGVVPSTPQPQFVPVCLHCSRQAVGAVRFVTDPDRRRRWIASLLDADEVSEEYFDAAQNRLSELRGFFADNIYQVDLGDVYLCRAHFRAEDFVLCSGRVILRIEAVPSPNHIAPELFENDGSAVNPDDQLVPEPFNFSMFEEALYEPYTAEGNYSLWY